MMAAATSPASSPLAIRRISGLGLWLARAAVMIVGSLLLWASARIEVPLLPVPVTTQTYVVLTLGALLGWRLGGATVAAYLAAAADAAET